MNGTAVWAVRRRASSAPILLLSLPLLGVARLLPAHGAGLWLRLVAASLVLFLPGALVARAMRLRGASATVAWGLAALAPALLLVFVVHGSILLALVVLGVVALVALPFALRVVSGPPPGATLVIALLGLAFGIVLWHVAGVVTGDALFHLGRVQKLYAFGDLHVRSVDEFSDGGLHPGYAFPLWHAFLALVAKVGGVSPTQVMLHEPSAIAPVAFVVVYEAGLALFRSAWLGAAVLVATVSAVALAPGHGGSFVLLSQPGTPRPPRPRGRGAHALFPLPGRLSRVGPRPLTCRDRRRGAARPHEHRRLSRGASARLRRRPRLAHPQRCTQLGHRARGALPAGRSRARLALAARPGDGLALAVEGRARARADEVRAGAGRRLAPITTHFVRR